MASKSSLYPSKSTPLSKTGSTSSKGSSSLAFTSSLSSLLATSASASLNTQTRPTRPSTKSAHQTRDSIFTTHVRSHKKNSNPITTTATKKRPFGESSEHEQNDSATVQRHGETSETVDAATLHRSKRKMEEKARLYASMKRGDYVPPTDGRGRDREAEGLVDFDRKWAESTTDARQGDDNNNNNNDTSSDDDYGDSEVEGGVGDNNNKMVEYEDEFGRLRHGTAHDVARHHRRQRAVQHATTSLADNSGRPQQQRPDNLIYGATVQAAAFNPDATLTAQMAGLASKRDRSPTPPEEVHYDARTEVRAKGVGFFQFSRDQEGREREMDSLGREREVTERGRKEREDRREERKRKVEERMRLVERKRGERLAADRFLEGLDVP